VRSRLREDRVMIKRIHCSRGQSLLNPDAPVRLQQESGRHRPVVADGQLCAAIGQLVQVIALGHEQRAVGNHRPVM
jgi:hypothetical protein